VSSFHPVRCGLGYEGPMFGGVCNRFVGVLKAVLEDIGFKVSIVVRCGVAL
jgi:arylamine N-acetyltransferase